MMSCDGLPMTTTSAPLLRVKAANCARRKPISPNVRDRLDPRKQRFVQPGMSRGEFDTPAAVHSYISPPVPEMRSEDGVQAFSHICAGMLRLRYEVFVPQTHILEELKRICPRWEFATLEQLCDVWNQHEPRIQEDMFSSANRLFKFNILLSNVDFDEARSVVKMFAGTASIVICLQSPTGRTIQMFTAFDIVGDRLVTQKSSAPSVSFAYMTKQEVLAAYQLTPGILSVELDGCVLPLLPESYLFQSKLGLLSGITHLCQAIRRCSEDECVRIFEGAHGQDLNGSDHGWNALHWAAFRGFRKLCTALLDHQSSHAVNAKTSGGLESALHLAAGEGHAGVCLVLLAHQNFTDINAVNSCGLTALHRAAASGNVRTVMAICFDEQFSLIGAKDCNGWTALHHAAVQSSGHVCTVILEHDDFQEANAREQKHGCTALLLAARHGEENACRALLSHPKTTNVNATDNSSCTALHYAARVGLADLCFTLLDHCFFTKADFANARGDSALHEAAREGYPDACLEIASHSKFNARDHKNRNGDTAADLASLAGHQIVFEYLSTDDFLGRPPRRPRFVFSEHLNNEGLYEVTYSEAREYRNSVFLECPSCGAMSEARL